MGNLLTYKAICVYKPLRQRLFTGVVATAMTTILKLAAENVRSMKVMVYTLAIP